VEGLPPELASAGHEYQANVVAVGTLGALCLTVEDDELLSQHCIFSNQISAAVGHI